MPGGPAFEARRLRDPEIARSEASASTFDHALTSARITTGGPIAPDRLGLESAASRRGTERAASRSAISRRAEPAGPRGMPAAKKSESEGRFGPVARAGLNELVGRSWLLVAGTFMLLRARYGYRLLATTCIDQPRVPPARTESVAASLFVFRSSIFVVRTATYRPRPNAYSPITK